MHIGSWVADLVGATELLVGCEVHPALDELKPPARLLQLAVA
jgi:hypothetical protein